MFDELTQDLLDLTSSEKGYRGAMYAQLQDGGGGGSLTLCCTVVLCCSRLCW